MKKVAFPKVCLPLIVIGSSLLHFAIISALFIVFLWVTGMLPGWVALDAIPLLVVEVALAIGLGILLGTINVFYRDVGQTMGIVLQFWFWLTPIVYVASIIPAPLRRLLEWNPMWPVVQGYQDIFTAGLSPHWPSIAWVGIIALVAMLLGMTAFARLQAEIVDDL
jgi:lipopolysaccharide transport system permease protein